ncbi:MAG: flagellar basal-body rod protein FlgG [Planctomycetes bacterium]|nr:flagellar basal-body rod protein FlgG [Planctomycetota bacterium]
MLRTFSTAATGMAANQLNVENIANNLANLNTTGFKRTRLAFEDLLYITELEPGRQIASGQYTPNGLEIGNGVRPVATMRIFTQGEFENTGRNLDVAIQGDGFFKVLMPDGSFKYSRDGALSMNANGILTTASGYYLDGSVTIPNDARSISISPDGTVSVLSGSSTTPSTVGQITLTRFPNPAGLSAESENLLGVTQASGSPIDGQPGQNGLGTILQGFLERSNVQMVTELVNLITAQRSYEINSKAVRAGDDMLAATNRIMG